MDFRTDTSDLAKNVATVTSNSDPFELTFDGTTVIKKKSNWATFD